MASRRHNCNLTQLSSLSCPACPPLQDAEAKEAAVQGRLEELRALEGRLGGIQQRLDGDAQRLKKAMAAVEEERAELKVP